MNDKIGISIKIFFLSASFFDLIIGWITTDGLRNTFSYSTSGYISWYWGESMILIFIIGYFIYFFKQELKKWIQQIIKESGQG